MAHHFKLASALLIGVYVAPSANSMNWSRSVPPPPVTAATMAQASVEAAPERMLIDTLNAVRSNRLDDALRLVDALIEKNPNYKLAHLIKGDLLLARTRPLTTLGNAGDAHAEKLNDLRAEAQVRLKHYLAPPPSEAIPASLVKLSPQQAYAVVVDATSSRLYMFRNDNGVPRYLLDFYVTIGKQGAGKNREGDQRTPVGVYFVTGKLPRADLDKTYGAQADLYGVGAWPLSYPNEWDKRQGRDGHGIWLHGSPSDTYSRPPLASNGCVVLTNPDMAALGRYLSAGTPVVITPRIEWLAMDEWRNRAAKAQAQLDHWRSDWEKLDTEHYLAHYSDDFRANGTDINTWRKQKSQINASKQWAKVKLENVSLFAYPAETPMLLTSFDQDYQSNNLNNRTRKRLYWKQEGAGWKIVYEGSQG